MIRRFLYYLSLSWKDLIRLWAVTQHHIIIVAGICLPILLLLGLKRGHVETLGQDLVTSPTGRQVTFWSSQQGELMNPESIDQLAEELPSVDLVIPETQRVVKMINGSGDDAKVVEAATIYSTRTGDPVLEQLNVEPPATGSTDVILSISLAEQLGASVGDEVQIVLARGRGPQPETENVYSKVTGIIATQEATAKVGYADVTVLDEFEAYIRGYRVPRFNWASAKDPAADSYAGYLLFCERTNQLSEDDVLFLQDRSFRVKEFKDAPAGLEHMLVADWREKIMIYHLTTERSATGVEHWLRIAPSQLSEGTAADDVVLAWNEPIQVGSGDSTKQLVGLSMSKRTWLREYLRDPLIAFDYEAEGNIQRPALSKLDDAGTEVKLRDGQMITLTSSRDVDKEKRFEGITVDVPEEAAAVVFVPATLLSWLKLEQSNKVAYDADISLFVAKSQPPVYDRARLFASTIDHVPDVVQELLGRKFAVMSETGRITEIQQQDQSLQLLVLVVGAGVFLFGVITVFSVLMDSTDRKRGTIGILRVMGMSRSGVFMTILLRAAAIGAVAAVLSVGLGYGLAAFLHWEVPATISWMQWKPEVSVSFDTQDVIIVAIGAMVCCVFGAVPPAFRASRLDPFDAIVEGRFH